MKLRQTLNFSVDIPAAIITVVTGLLVASLVLLYEERSKEETRLERRSDALLHRVEEIEKRLSRLENFEITRRIPTDKKEGPR